MKRFGLVCATCLFFPLGAVALHGWGWFGGLSASAVPLPPARVWTASSTQIPLSSAAAQRWRRGEPHHWRACLLQH